MALNRDSSNTTPRVPNVESSNEQHSFETMAQPISSPAPQAKKPTEDTYLKIKLSSDRTARDTWLKQMTSRADGIREFSDGKITAFTHPRFSGIKFYNHAEKENYFAADAVVRNAGLIGRFEVYTSKVTESRPVPKTGIVGDIHMSGLLGSDNKVKSDSVRIFGDVLGKDKPAIFATLQENAVRARAFRARSPNVTYSSSSASSDTSSASSSDAMDMDFGM
jgi:hypothetical protein